MTNNNMKKEKKYYGISLAAIMIAAFVLVQPMNAYSQEVGAEGILLNGCTIGALQPDPIDMNTVVGKKGTANVAKTIHREKEVLTCHDANDPTITYNVEVATFLEIVENLDTKSIIRKQSETIICIKDPSDGEIFECQKRFPTTQSIATFDCFEIFIAEPNEMNTVVNPAAPSVVKTIDAEKEVFFCNNGQAPDILKKVDVVIFTELWENLDKLPNNPVVKRVIESVRCVMSVPLGIVESCIFSTVPLVTPP